MKQIFLFLLTFFFFTQSSYAILKVTKLPYKDAEIERIYKLDNGKYSSKLDQAIANALEKEKINMQK